MNDTIAALATPCGESAIAVIRMSGEKSLIFLADIFERKQIVPRVMYRGHYRSSLGVILDDAMFVFFRGKSSYTGEDSAEIYTHGNMIVVSEVLGDLCERGCRLADRGEFTKRAFLSGKIDLCQAEAVADVIHASSEVALAMAQRQLADKFSKKLSAIGDELLLILAALETHIDFAEEEICGNDLDEKITRRLEAIIADIDSLLDSNRYRPIISGGLSVAIIGAPNAGKSSLFNCLLNAERALVSPIAGTTRDFISERIMLGGYAINLFDTAGLRTDAESELELRGMEKTIEQIHRADAHLFVIDSSAEYPTLDRNILPFLGESNCLILENKSDLPSSRVCCDFLPKCEHCRISALGEPDLARASVANFLAKRCFLPKEVEIVVGARHVDILTRAKRVLDETRQTLAAIGVEFSANNIRNALEIFGEMTGRYSSEAMLDSLFSTFCVGK
ncbi:MAG: tRNA uridine-5-carboxymethylaminomethyl(34) synthesis GTPase MnmE [Puniceicoccales bacterium]|jgi:tRNA modification GTPase|nr:tRNA uridine-5-carboxymethylaminomethyl(34) synthesis GTPase MnmE [Puniceicoccales bacterium]